MGTTLTAAAVLPDGSGIAFVNIGDSRAYVWRDGELRRLTRDHSMVQDLVDAGELTAEAARLHPQRAILTRVLGMSPAIDPDLFAVPTHDGDRLLLCTDGLVNELDEPAIGAVLAATNDPAQAARELVQLATTSGGQDNSSAVVIDVTATS